MRISSVIFLLCIGLNAHGGIFLEKPWGFQISTELEKNQGVSFVTQDLLQNWSFIPRRSFADGKLMVKVVGAFGYSLLKPFQVFLYDAQIRLEVNDLFPSLKNPIFQTGMWIYGPVSKVSRDDSTIVSMRAFLKTGGRIAFPQWSWNFEVDGRYWFNQFSTHDPRSNHPQQRSGLHEFPKSMKHDPLTDRVVSQAKLATVVSFSGLAQTARFFNNLWISLEGHYRWAMTYASSPLSSQTYHSLIVYNGLTYAFTKNFFFDFNVQHAGRTSGANKIKFFGRGTSYYIGFNVEL